MAHTGSKPSFFIIYGWISGPGHGRKLSRLLQAAGFTPAGTAGGADIIITHSAGYYLIPQNSGKIVVLVGPTLNSLTFANWLRANWENARMFWKDRHALKGLRLNLLHAADVILRPSHNLKIAKAARLSAMPALEDSNVLMIANQYDPWPKKSGLDDFVVQTPWVFMSMRGAHENIWEEPESYVAVIEAYAKRLLA